MDGHTDEKMQLMLKLQSLEERKKITLTKTYNMSSTINDVQTEYIHQLEILAEKNNESEFELKKLEHEIELKKLDNEIELKKLDNEHEIELKKHEIELKKLENEHELNIKKFEMLDE